MNFLNSLQILFLSAVFACNAAKAQSVPQSVTLDKKSLSNPTAYIPPQCYTVTADSNGNVSNPCYVCHTKSVEPNYINDQDLQLFYSFPEMARTNPWTNLFADRRERVAGISDDEILSFVRKSNYFDKSGTMTLTEKLQNLPKNWDYNKNKQWDGFRPDCAFNFDSRGFDRSPGGDYTGWRAYGYSPFPATYWPTNGAAGDVMIRLPESFRKSAVGSFDLKIYEINLAVVESLIARRDIFIEPTDEKLFGVDLNQDGVLNEATQVTYSWPAGNGKTMSYVGAAGQELASNKLHLAAGLFPVGTEFLHSIRYLDIVDNDQIIPAARMKELQYMQKKTWQTYADLEESALAEMKERDDFPDRNSQFVGDSEHGVYNGSGWLLQGFIEDADGELRPQSYEETVSCVGCHGGIGATTDSVFSFARKVAGKTPHNGWFHWGSEYLRDISEPKTELYQAGVFYEYSYYLMYNSSGNDFRNNPEVVSRYTLSDKSLNIRELVQLQGDISRLLLPSPERALQLNKAYTTIVTDQDYIHGRDVNIEPITTVHKQTEIDQPTTIAAPTNPVAFGNAFGPHHAAGTVPAAATAPQPQSEKEVLGASMTGPDGQAYIANWQGIINKSNYQSSIKGVQMVFPDRLTLPTRPIIPTAGNPSCMVCHRVARDNAPTTKPAAKEPQGRSQLTIEGSNHTGRFSPDGRYIAFVSDRGGSEQIWLMDQDGRNQHQVTRGPAEHSWPNWKHDSRQLVFIAHAPGSSAYAVKRYSLDDKSEKVLISSSRMINRPTYHPLDNIIAYSAQTGANWDVWLTTEDGQQQFRVTSAPDMESNPLWSPDGKTLAYKVAPAGGKYSLTSQNFATFTEGYDKPAIHTWQGPESVQMNDWSPDGAKITYTAETIGGASGTERVTYSALISDLTLSDGKADTAHTLFASEGLTLGDRGPVFSPDGRYVAFWGWNTDFKAGLWLCDLEGKQTSSLPSGGFDMYPQWSPDGRKLLFEVRVGDSSQLVIADVAVLLAGRRMQLAVD